MASANSRLLAIKIINSLREQQGSLTSLLDNLLRDQDSDNKALVQAICFGVCRQLFLLQHLVDHFLQKPLRNKDQDIYCLLLIGSYQLLFMRMPDYAVIHECVACCTKLRKEWAKKLVNAILRSVQRDGASLVEQTRNNPALYFSHPDWMLKLLQQDWPDYFLEILAANNQQAPMTLRINQSKTTPDACLATLKTQGIEAEPGKLSPNALILSRPLEVYALPGFQEGVISVQDEASQLVAPLLQVHNGETVLDACAAPGGKTCAILESSPEAILVAIDNEPQRLQKVADNLHRIGASAELICKDIREQARSWQSQQKCFDRILLDVPCTATGVIRRHPDIKLLRQAEDLEKLLSLQAEILREVWPLLKPGGYMLYSTCSLFRSENTIQVAAFLASHPDAREAPIKADWGLAETHGRQLLPQPHSHDGFYYALLQKC